MKKIHLFLLLILSIGYAIKIILISNSLLILHYPFISPDGFDWITEGVWLAQTLQGKNTANIVLPVARPPLFVLITAIDALLGQKGYVIASALGLSFFVTGLYASKFINEKNSFVLFSVFLIALLFTPVNFVRNYILSDAICVSLSLVASYYLLKFKEKLSHFKITLLAAIISLAGITQTYGLIAPFVILGVLLVFALKEKKIHIITEISTVIFLSVLFFLGGTFLWFSFIPHSSRPMNFEYLKISSTMTKFYFNTWSYYFAPFIPMFLSFLLVKKHAIFNDRSLISLWLVVIIFMVMVFFYQWPESRFTFMFWPFFVIAIFRSGKT